MFKSLYAGALVLAFASPILHADTESEAKVETRIATVVSGDLKETQAKALRQVENALRAALAEHARSFPGLNEKEIRTLSERLKKDLEKRLKKSGKDGSVTLSVVTTSDPKVFTEMHVRAVGPDGKPLELDEETVRKLIRKARTVEHGRVSGELPEAQRERMRQRWDGPGAQAVPAKDREVILEEIEKKLDRIERMLERLLEED